MKTLKKYEVGFLYDGIYKRTTVEAASRDEIEEALAEKMERNGMNTAKEWQITDAVETTNI